MKIQGDLKITESKRVAQAVQNELYIKNNKSLEEIKKIVRIYGRRKIRDNNEDSEEGVD